MRLMISKKPIAIALAAAVTVGSVFVPGVTGVASAAPLSTNAQALEEVAPDDVIDVQRWRRHRSGAAIAGLALGIIGAAIVAREYRRHRRHHGYYYGPHHYYGGYAPRAYHYRHYHHRQDDYPTQFCHICGVN